MTEENSAVYTYDHGQVEPGETAHFRFQVSETYVSDPIRLPITVMNGEESGPTVFLSAAVHGDELNGIEVINQVIEEFDHTDIHGTLVCLHVVNVPGFNAQERTVPLDGDDLNRSFPGSDEGTATQRIAHSIYTNFVEPCDFGIDLHTSTRGRTNLIHARGNLDDPDVSRLAHAFATHVIIDGTGPADSLRRAASEDDTPTIVVEMGEANRLQREIIDTALEGVRSVFAEVGLCPDGTVRWPGWRTVVGTGEKEWVRADAGGVVDMHAEDGEIVHEGEPLCSIRNPFDRTLTRVEAPFTGVLVGVLENPVVYPGNPICHIAELTDSALDAFEAKNAVSNRTE